MEPSNTIPRSLVAAALLSALVIMPVAVFAQDNQNSQGQNQNYSNTSVGSSVSVSINNSGKVSVMGAKITAIGSSTITATTMWGSNALTWAINTDSNTKLLRRYDGASSLSEFSVGDYIAFQGSLNTSMIGLTVLATRVQDLSIQKVNASVSGTVLSIASSSSSLIVSTNNKGNVTITTSSSTLITRGGSTIVFGGIMVGDKLNATGVYDNNSHILAATKIVVSVPKILEKHTFEGKLQSSIGTTSLPTSFTMQIGGTNYTVNVGATVPVLNKNWASVTLSTFVAGDNVRVYGSVEAANLTTIDAVVVRDASR